MKLFNKFGLNDDVVTTEVEVMALQRKSRVSPRDRALKVGKFAAAVSARRQEINMSQTEVADLAGVARTSVAALEGGRNVSLETLLAILDVLGLHLELVRGAAATLGVSAQLERTYNLADQTGPAAPAKTTKGAVPFVAPTLSVLASDSAGSIAEQFRGPAGERLKETMDRLLANVPNLSAEAKAAVEKALTQRGIDDK